jgi:hypothetical protein
MGNRRTRTLVSCLVAGMLIGACGSGSGHVSASLSTTPRTTKPSSAPDTPAQRAADRAVAARAVLTLADFPLGWTSNPHDTSSSSGPPPAVQRAVIACAHLPQRFLDNRADTQPNVNSADFTKGVVGAGPAAQIQSSVELDRTVRDISQPLAQLAAPGAAACFAPLFRSEFSQGLGKHPGVSLADFSLNALSVGSIGDQSAGFQSRVTIVGQRASINLEVDLYFVRVKRAIVVLSAIAFSVPFDQGFAQTLLEKMVGRLTTV